VPRGPGAAAQCLHLGEQLGLAAWPLWRPGLRRLRFAAAFLLPGLAVCSRLIALPAAGRVAVLAGHRSPSCSRPPGSRYAQWFWPIAWHGQLIDTREFSAFACSAEPRWADLSGAVE